MFPCNAVMGLSVASRGHCRSVKPLGPSSPACYQRRRRPLCLCRGERGRGGGEGGGEWFLCTINLHDSKQSTYALEMLCFGKVDVKGGGHRMWLTTLVVPSVHLYRYTLLLYTYIQYIYFMRVRLFFKEPPWGCLGAQAHVWPKSAKMTTPWGG